MSARRPRNEASAAAIAVIDVGSNSVRLVVYDRLGPAPLAILNEKALCGLGRTLATSGALDPEGSAAALAAIRRFGLLLSGMGVVQIEAVGTAAIRDATDGAAFVARVKAETGIAVRVISGGEEATLSALGVLAGIPDARGLCGDLGGGSLELVGLEADGPGDNSTLPIGPLRLQSLPHRRAINDVIDQEFARVRWLARFRGQPLYVVGGGWRSLARIHMAQTQYPLRVIQHYALRRGEIEDLTHTIAGQSPGSLRSIEGVPRARRNVLPAVAAVMLRLIAHLGPGHVVFSATGLREGILRARLDAADRAADPLLAGCRRLAAGAAAAAGEPEADFFTWMAPLFAGESEAERRLRSAACVLSDIARATHPEYRAETAMAAVLHAPLAAIDHGGRAFVALAVGARHNDTGSSPSAAIARRLVDEAAAERAARVGLALRLGYALVGRSGSLLRQTGLVLTPSHLRLELDTAVAGLWGEGIERRLGQLADAYGRRPELRAG